MLFSSFVGRFFLWGLVRVLGPCRGFCVVVLVFMLVVGMSGLVGVLVVFGLVDWRLKKLSNCVWFCVRVVGSVVVVCACVGLLCRRFCGLGCIY